MSAVIERKPDMVLIAGDILPKYDGLAKQREFFPELRSIPSTVGLYDALGNNLRPQR